MMKIQKTELEYISDVNIADLLDCKAIAIKSAMGTGKTSLAQQFVQTIENQEKRNLRVLVITHRKFLSLNLAQRFDYECYSHLDNDEIGQASKLVLTVNSIGRLVGYENLPELSNRTASNQRRCPFCPIRSGFFGGA